jgi:hypothetical protein
MNMTSHTTRVKTRLRAHNLRVVRTGERDGARLTLTACTEDECDRLGWFTREEMTISEQEAAPPTTEAVAVQKGISHAPMRTSSR